MNKSKNTLIGIIIVLSIAVLGLGGFIIYDKVITPKPSNEGNNVNNEVKNLVDDTYYPKHLDYQKYVDMINPASIGPSNLIFDASEVKANILSAAEKIGFVTGNFSLDEYISEQEVKYYVEKLFGPNTYERSDFDIFCHHYSFDESTKSYKRPANGCGGTSSAGVKNIVIDYTKTDTKLEIITAYVFESRNVINDERELYKDYQQQINLGKINVNNSIEKYIEENQNNLSHITYTYESTDGVNYYFTKLVNNK